MADNDNDENAREAERLNEAGADEKAGGIMRLAASRRDKHADILEILMAESSDLALESLKWAKLEDYDSDVREMLVKQGVSLAGCYTRLAAASERHRKSLRDGG